MSKANQHTDTICALATPPGIGAIGVIRITGNKAFNICNQLYSNKDLTKQKSHTLHYGLLKDNDNLLDEVVLNLYKGPYSYTGEDTIEISCHGSPYIQQKIIQTLIKKGARQAEAGEFTLRAFLNGKLDLAQAEAVADVIASNSAISQQIAINQMRGGFSNEIKDLRAQLVQFASLVELELDFSEEDVEFADRTQLGNLIDKIQLLITRLTSSFEMGNVIKKGVPVVIAGKPNVGKSTLLNKLLNDERAIVSEIAGTTRDTIEEELIIEGISFRFIDTAGIRDTEDTIESIGVKKSLEKLKTSTVVLYMFDVHECSAGDLKQIVKDLNKELSSNAKLILIGNKIDVENEQSLRNEYHDFDVVYISAREGLHIDDLKQRLLQEVNIDDVNPDQTIVTNLRHFEALTNANAALDRVQEGMNNQISGDLLAMDIRDALAHLGSITGDVSSDEILGSIFSQFCIGK